MKSFTYILFSLFLIAFALPEMGAQDTRLASQYYNTGEYEKAAALYKRIYKSKKINDYYFNKYIECLLAIEQYDEAEEAIREELKKNPGSNQLYVTYGNLYEKQGLSEKADDQYKKAIENLPKDVGIINRTGNLFTGLAKYDLAIEVFEKGEEMVDRGDIFSFNLADLYRRKGNSEKMIYYYLNSVDRYRNSINNFINTIERNLNDEDHQILQAQLYERIQSGDDNPLYYDVLEWTFIDQKQYRKAYRQARSLDRRNEENGGRVYEIGEIAYNAGDYDVAIEAFQYITENKGQNSSYYLDAKSKLLNAKRKKITKSYDYTQEDLMSVEREYNDFLDEFGRNRQTALLLSEFANFEALYLNDLDTAIIILQEVVQYAGVPPYINANAKLDLADYLLMKGDVWESTLLYGQVDKAMKESILGERARFRNAMLSYYRGEFEWAQEQFDILKTATSKLISNDAIDRSVFIMDNLNLDTTDVPMKMYAQAELLMFQNLYDRAFEKLDSILLLYPEHGLQDDILYSKANIFVKKRAYDQAVAAYDSIIVKYSEEIRADNALFELGNLYENVLDDIEKAKSLYEKLFLEYSGSTYAVEARKRFRILRGDEVQ